MYFIHFCDQQKFLSVAVAVRRRQCYVQEFTQSCHRSRSTVGHYNYARTGTVLLTLA
jgi:hypothetical protein